MLLLHKERIHREGRLLSKLVLLGVAGRLLRLLRQREQVRKLARKACLSRRGVGGLLCRRELHTSRRQRLLPIQHLF